jgi:uncharacterized protein Yka (UPF0111/DUF47 family)
MLGRLMPREARFFDLFNQHADRIVDGAHHLLHLMQHYDDSKTRQRELDAIDEIETSADKVTHETLALLHKTFVTPFDREDIHQLISRMDDVLDASLNQMCCERVRTAVSMLSDMENGGAILKLCEEIDQLESDADRVMRAAMSKLFRDESDVRQLIKLKAIYEQLEGLTDTCKDVAKILEGVVLENA